jgi:hypothetical protein
MISPKKIILPILVVLLVILAGLSFYFYREANALKENPQAAAQKEAERLVTIVGKLIDLPEGEIPTVATVSDPERLRDQPFFEKAKVGDKVLLYSNAKKAYLFDPASNKLLEVAPINLGEQSGQILPEDI